MKVMRTEQIWLKGDKTLAELCHLSKNLYNEANYIVRQELFNTGKWIRYNELNKLLKESSDNYKALPAQMAQQILILVDKSWESFFKAIRVWKAHPEKFKERPRIPGYKKKDGEHILVFTNQQAKLKDGWLILPKLVGQKVKTRIKDGLREVRIIPKGVGYVLEIVYKKMVEAIGKGRKTDRKRIVGIDLGSANIVTMVNNIGEQPIVVKDDGRGIKSINQFYNKLKAELQSIYDSQGIKDGAKLRGLRAKRDRKAKDYVHKLSRFIVDWCVEHEIGIIIFGYNGHWKQNINIGRRNNQTFTQIPFMEIIHKTAYKAEEKGIEVKKQEESHTSKCSFLDNEPIEHREDYVGRRISRSLFKTAKGTIIHADVNAGYNIIEKANPKAFRNGCEWIGGCGLHPVRCNLKLIASHEGV